MNYYLSLFFTSSIIFAGIIALVRFPKLEPGFYPFIICTWIAGINEILSFIMTMLHINTSLNNNIYVLLEVLLLLWQFKNWGLFIAGKKWLVILIVAVLTLWIYENLLLSHYTGIKLYARLFYSFIIVLLSIQCNSRLVMNYRKHLFSSPVFLICAGCIIFFTYKILMEVFWFYGLDYTAGFRNAVFNLFTYINLFANLIFLIAILWMPRKKAFLRPLLLQG